MPDQPGLLVSTDWLDRHLSDPSLRILDASWYLPNAGRDARAEFAAAHIPGARFADIDLLSDATNSLPHMAPTPEDFARLAAPLGLADAAHVVVYDGAGLFSAARIWWLLRLMGRQDVSVLDGGLPKWRAEGRGLEQGAPSQSGAVGTARFRPELVRDLAAVEAAAMSGAAQIVDARAAARFQGAAPEPRPGLRSGHIPGSSNIPFGEVLNPDGTMKSVEDLRAVFAAAGVDLARPVITSCGSGVTAAVLSLALERIGHRDHALYDGSWAEWGGVEHLAVATGGQSAT